jgi:hypothetical protein
LADAGGGGGGAKCFGGAQPVFIAANIAISNNKLVSSLFMVDVFFFYNNREPGCF